MEKLIFHTLKYFSFFNYAPTFEEIYIFLPKKTSKKRLKDELERLIKKKKLITFNFKSLTFPRYTLGEYDKKTSNIKYQISKRKLDSWRFKLYVRLLSLFPQIKLVGLSGSMAMMNAKEEDDIDLFIIAAKNRLFTSRFLALVLAQLLHLRRKRGSETQFLSHENFTSSTSSKGPLESEKIAFSSPYKDKICLNLFFDESHLEVPKFKKTEYVAHEILQMKPIINKVQTYERFLYVNRWIIRFFPNNIWINSKLKIKNAKSQFKIQNFKFLIVILRFTFYILNFITENIEKLLKGLQFYVMNRHRTNEIITDTQLWFHPEDFGKKVDLSL